MLRACLSPALPDRCKGCLPRNKVALLVLLEMLHGERHKAQPLCQEGLGVDTEAARQAREGLRQRRRHGLGRGRQPVAAAALLNVEDTEARDRLPLREFRREDLWRQAVGGKEA